MLWPISSIIQAPNVLVDCVNSTSPISVGTHSMSTFRSEVYVAVAVNNTHTQSDSNLRMKTRTKQLDEEEHKYAWNEEWEMKSNSLSRNRWSMCWLYLRTLGQTCIRYMDFLKSGFNLSGRFHFSTLVQSAFGFLTFFLLVKLESLKALPRIYCSECKSCSNDFARKIVYGSYITWVKLHLH